MLKIRNEQLKAIQQAMREAVVQRLVEHLQKCFSKRVQALKPEERVALVEESVETAMGFGIDAEASLHRFCDMQFVLGRYFYESPRYPWAARILADPLLPDPNAKIDAMAKIAASL